MVDPVWRYDPWGEGTTADDEVEQRVPKSPRTQGGKGRWDVGPLATTGPRGGSSLPPSSTEGLGCSPTSPATTIPGSHPDAFTDAFTMKYIWKYTHRADQVLHRVGGVVEVLG